jgi:uncharacterized membrane protein (GlpM family)
MIYFLIKLIITAVAVVLISEISKRSSFIGGILASIPLTSILAFIWMYNETKDIEKISALSFSIFWLVIPSLVLFIVLPLLLKKGISFYLSLGITILVTAVCYYLMLAILAKFGIRI